VGSYTSDEEAVVEVDDPDGVPGADAGGGVPGAEGGSGSGGRRKKKELKPSDILTLVGEMTVAKKELREQDGVINNLKNKLEIFGDLEEAKVCEDRASDQWSRHRL
jgi:hypothetical protein